MKKKLVRLTESDLHKIIKESVQQILKESFNSKIIQNLCSEHGGINLDEKPMYIKGVLSQITDDMVDQVYNSKEEYANETNNELDYLFNDAPFWIPFNDGTIVTLKQPQDGEEKRLYTQLFNRHSGTVWVDRGRESRRNGKKWADFNRNNYYPDGFRGDDYYEIMQHAKNNGYKIPDFDKDPNKSINMYGSELDRTMERMNMAKAKRHGKFDEYLDYLDNKHKNYRKPRP